jgi:molecular chaperone GrpE
MIDEATIENTQEPLNDAPPSGADVGVSEVEALRTENAELKDKFVRAYAEMENVRRRAERDRADLLKFGMESVFKDFLPVLDSLQKALPDEAHTDGGDGYLTGMIMVKKQLLDALKKHGLEAIAATRGTPFDPNHHQGISRVESEEVQGEVVGEEYARGYALHGRLLRAAMVSVLVPKEG